MPFTSSPGFSSALTRPTHYGYVTGSPSPGPGPFSIGNVALNGDSEVLLNGEHINLTHVGDDNA